MGPAHFGSASVVTKMQEFELNQPLIITFAVPNWDGDSDFCTEWVSFTLVLLRHYLGYVWYTRMMIP